MPAKVISIATHKGGTGKTVTSMALAAGLARLQRRVLLIDLDPQGHSTIGLGVEVGAGELSLRDVFTEPPALLSRIRRRTHLATMDVIPSNIRLERASQYIYARPRREELLRRSLMPVLADYDEVVIDCPPSLGALTESGIAAADLVIVPCQMEARAADGLVDLLELISVLKGEEFHGWRILLTKVDPRKTITNQAVLAALSAWEDKMFKSQIPQSEPLNQAQIERTDIFTFDGKSKGALAYEALVEEVLAWRAQAPAPAPEGSLSHGR